MDPNVLQGILFFQRCWLKQKLLDKTDNVDNVMYLLKSLSPSSGTVSATSSTSSSSSSSRGWVSSVVAPADLLVSW